MLVGVHKTVITVMIIIVIEFERRALMVVIEFERRALMVVKMKIELMTPCGSPNLPE